MKRLIILLVVSSIAFTVAVTAQSGAATTPTNSTTPAPAGAPSGVDLVIDSETAVVDYRIEDGEIAVDIYSTAYKSISFGPAVSSSAETGTVQSQTRVVSADQVTTVRIASPDGVTIWTDESVESGRFHYIKPSDSVSLFGSGTFTGSDVRNAGIGGALGVVIAVLYEAVAAKVGSSQRGERVA